MKKRVGMDGWAWKDETDFKKYRVAELKHGRLAMLAAGGMIANIFWKWPGFEDVPGGLAALSDGQGGSGFGIIFLVSAYVELNWPEGNFTDPLQFGAYDNWGYSDELKNKEIANGRLAMCWVVTSWFIENCTQLPPPEQYAHVNVFQFLVPLVFLGFAWGNPNGWPAEYIPTSGSPLPSSSAPSLASLPEEIKAEKALPEADKEEVKTEAKAS
jgi:hypothetical protein